MSFAAPLVLLLLVPLAGLLGLAVFGGHAQIGRLPGAWHRVVAPVLRGYLATRSNLGRAGAPILCFAVAALVVLAMSRPGIETDDQDMAVNLAGRVVILDVGSDLAQHRLFLDELYRTDAATATAVIAVSGDAYRIIPFTTDKSQIDRYVRVLNAEMMPKPGHNPHIAVAQAERILASSSYLARQIVVLTARPAPPQSASIPPGKSQRFVIPLGSGDGWPEWAQAQNAVLLGADGLAELTQSLRRAAQDAANAQLPAARHEFTTALIALAALLWLPMFRRRSS